jgi:glycogen synthase
LIQAGMRWLESSFPDRARAWVGFNESVSHRITAAADILLMPSRFEPCGLNQLYAMRCADESFGRPATISDAHTLIGCARCL